ncbi:MAG: hypothetical protein A3F72_07255 [Bacteroidetes bacterium RIFCSPLOWO2_12_FULL_35_15]|nr:MAG: hypothetical protein A3F72_07255 [Bacteroidetes bacterium RIFCSPLOWO2_12_FULL_35_15]
MTKQELHTKAQFILALLIAFTLPFARLTPVFIALMLLNWLIEGDFKNKFAVLVRNKWFWLFELLYFIHLIGMIYTANLPSGLFDLEVKFSIFIFPIIFCSRPLKVDLINQILKVFCVAAIIASIAMLSRATFLFATKGENDFFYEAFSFLIHPSYLSMYINFLLVWILLGLFGKGGVRANLKPLYSWILIVFFFIINVLLSSKMGMISMLILFFSFGIYYITLSKKYLLGAFAIVIFISAILFSSVYIPAIEHRVSFAIAALTKNEIKKTSDESSEVRMLIWKTANEIIRDHPIIGVGTGDAKDVLLEEYAKRGMTGAIEHKLNAHNEFYQVFISLGIIGFITLLANLFFPLVQAIKDKNLMIIFFLLIIIFNYLPESMLETQAGVMFYAFFNSLLCFNSTNNQH